MTILEDVEDRKVVCLLCHSADNEGKKLTKADFLRKYNEMMHDKLYAKNYLNGTRADINYGTWEGMGKEGKAQAHAEKRMEHKLELRKKAMAAFEEGKFMRAKNINIEFESNEPHKDRTTRAKGIGKKLIPGVATFVALYGLKEDIKNRGLAKGLLNSGMDALPFFGQAKAIAETIENDDFVQ